MSLLSRYVCRYFVRFLAGGLGLCTGLFFLVELFDRIDEFVERQVLWQDAAYYLVMKLPEIVYRVVPAAFLLASVLTFSTLNKYQESTAMRAMGVSPLRLTRPLFLLGAMGCLSLLLMQEYVLPYTNQMYSLIWRTRIRLTKTEMGLGLVRQGEIWYHSAPRIWHVQISAPFEQRLLGVTIYELDSQGLLRQRYDVAEARWDAQGWLLLQGTRHTFNAQGMFADPPEVFAALRVPFTERLADIVAVRKRVEDMGLQETLAYAQRLQRRGATDPSYLVEFHGRLAFAAVCIFMAGFGVPLALHANRSGGIALALGLTLVCGFSYWVLHSAAMALGQHGQVPPVLAAWFANGVFGAGSVYLSWRLS